MIGAYYANKDGLLAPMPDYYLVILSKCTKSFGMTNRARLLQALSLMSANKDFVDSTWSLLEQIHNIKALKPWEVPEYIATVPFNKKGTSVKY